MPPLQILTIQGQDIKALPNGMAFLTQKLQKVLAVFYIYRSEHQ